MPNTRLFELPIRSLQESAGNGAVLGIALKSISHYLDHISPATLDEALAAESK
jgi:hypothetical protein